jgi:tetratricopeptide (TPR) repeat protein
MKGSGTEMGVIKAIIGAAIVVNLLSIGLWMYVNPPATYERLADRELREAHAAYRKESAAKSYAMYRSVVERYPRSTFASEASFYSARAAFLGLGQFEVAEKEFVAYLATNPTNEEHRAEAEEYLDLIRKRSDLPADARDGVLWEYVQAVVEDGNGQYRDAVARLEWVVGEYRATEVGKKAAALLPRVNEKLNQV